MTLGGRAPRTANWASFYRQKTTLSAYYIRVTKWLVTCLQSNLIGTNFAGYIFTKQFHWYNLAGFGSNLKQFYWYKGRRLLFKLRRPRAFPLSRGLLLGAYWLAGSTSPDGGGESHHFTGNRNPSPSRLPAPAPVAPHNKTYFSASKPTRKISDTWIIDTDKRETSQSTSNNSAAPQYQKLCGPKSPQSCSGLISFQSLFLPNCVCFGSCLKSILKASRF